MAAKALYFSAIAYEKIG